MSMTPRLAWGLIASCSVLLLGTSGAARAQSADDTEALAKAAQNPVADMISLPFQFNTNLDTGHYGGTQEILNVQPVIPFNLSPDWNLITRIITPLVEQPKLFPGDDVDYGLGDITPTLFLSPANSGKFIWGVGPVFLLPTATSSDLGSGKWGIGPSAVGLVMDGHWVYGALINNIWSVAGDTNRQNVNQMTLQPFINYNFKDGWYLTSSPILTANWEADNANRWTVPIGGGFGRVFRIGKQPINAQLSAYYNALTPEDTGAGWQVRAQVQFLFPTKK